MLILENVVKKDNKITANYSFPGIDVIGDVVYDVQKSEISEAHFGDYEPKEVYGFYHLKKALQMMVRYNKFPKRYEYFWY